MLYATTLDGEPDNTVYFWSFPGNIPVEEVRAYLEAASYQIVFETPYVKWHQDYLVLSIEEGVFVEPDFFLNSKVQRGTQIVSIRNPDSYGYRYYLADAVPPEETSPIEDVFDWNEARFAAVGPNIAKLLFSYWERHGYLDPGYLEGLVKTEWERRAALR